jgi:ATP-dependent exoDNAse (exonuclease V) alpha subunit
MLVLLTKNVRKSDGFVNGMRATVRAFYPRDGTVRVRTVLGRELMLTRWTDRDKGSLRYVPVRAGYATTIHKIQGSEPPHVTIWLDACFSGAGYTALSRVKDRDNYLVGGDVTREHFEPVQV